MKTALTIAGSDSSGGVDPNFDFHSVEEFYKIYVFFKEGEEEEKDIEHMCSP